MGGAVSAVAGVASAVGSISGAFGGRDKPDTAPNIQPRGTQSTLLPASEDLQREFEVLSPGSFSEADIQEFRDISQRSIKDMRERLASSAVEQREIFNDAFGRGASLAPGIQAGFGAFDELQDLLGVSRPAIGSAALADRQRRFQNTQDDLQNQINTLRAERSTATPERRTEIESQVAELEQQKSQAEAAFTQETVDLEQAPILSGAALEERLLGAPGAQFELEQGIKAIERSAAARGLLQSGSTLQELQRFGQGLASQRFGERLGQLGQLVSLGRQDQASQRQLAAERAGLLADLSTAETEAALGLSQQEAQAAQQALFGKETAAAFGFSPSDLGQITQTGQQLTLSDFVQAPKEAPGTISLTTLEQLRPISEAENPPVGESRVTAAQAARDAQAAADRAREEARRELLRREAEAAREREERFLRGR